MSGSLGALSFTSGVLLGFSSSLHCAGMCGGIAASLMLGLGRASGQVRTLLTLQAGRVAAYVAAGAFLGSAGAMFYGRMDHGAGHAVLRAVAAMSLGWAGLSMLGLAPPLTFADRFAGPLSARLRLAPGGSFALPVIAPFIAGLGWGLLPCGMVYAALFYAVLSGSGGSGALIMMGFGLGTLPAVTLTALGIGTLRDYGRSPRIRTAAGLAILAVAAASVLVPAIQSGQICFH